MSLLRGFLKLAGTLLLLVVALTVGYFLYCMATTNSVVLETGDTAFYALAGATQVYDRNGELLADLSEEKREYVPIEKIPPTLQLATIAIEDTRFFQHNGVDLRGILRALYSNLVSGRITQGGSTITQQLARNLYLTQKRTLSRKMQEIAIALRLERRFTKEEILEMYLNRVYYGSGAYGVGMAAKAYFGKPVEKLNLSECALLAGIPRRPSYYSPYVNPEAAIRIRNIVLDRMSSLGFITREEAEEAKKMPLKLAYSRPPHIARFKAPYFVFWVIDQLADKYGNDLVYKGGLKIYTTLDMRLQRIAEEAVKRGLERAKGLNAHQAALVAIDYRTGNVVAMVGGKDFSESQFNRATQAVLQPGSAFKIFVYTTALDNGFDPNDTVVDSPISYPGGKKPWRPQNFDRKFRGRVTLRYAFEQSINVPAVKIAEKVGIKKVIEYARRMGITTPLAPYLPTAIGASGVRVIDMASAVGVIANNGLRCKPNGILEVRTADGTLLERRKPLAEFVISEETARKMQEMMRGVVVRGTGRRAIVVPGAAGKTGTSNDFRAAWFVGYAKDLACAVWVGNDDCSPMRRVVGGYIPCMIWADFMKKAVEIWKYEERTTESEESNIVKVHICDETGLVATPYCPSTHVEEFRRGFEPHEKCDVHTGRYIEVTICAESRKIATPYCPVVKKVRVPMDKMPTETCDIHASPPSEEPGNDETSPAPLGSQ